MADEETPTGNKLLGRDADLTGWILTLKDAPYYAHHGRFVQRYTGVESALHLMFRHVLGSGDETGRAISGGMRLADVINTTKRLMKTRNLPVAQQDDFKAITDHLGEITKLRDFLVHRSSYFDGRIVTSTNETTSKSVDDIQVLKLNIKDIDGAANDCARVMFRIAALIWGPNHGLPPEAVQNMLEPWSYKHRQPETPNRVSRSNPQEPQHPPPPSSS